MHDLPLPPRAVIFDLDGTLLDTLDDLADSGNAALNTLGFATHPVDAYRWFVGLGVAELARRMLPEGAREDANVARASALLVEEYKARWKDKTRPYDGVPEMLEQLRAAGLPLCVLSNKPQGFTEITVGQFFPGFPFRMVCGARPEVPSKPHPAGALAIAGELGVAPGAFCFVGDSSTDMKTARGAGMLPVGVLWGFRPQSELEEHGARLLAARPGELAHTLLGRAG